MTLVLFLVLVGYHQCQFGGGNEWVISLSVKAGNSKFFKTGSIPVSPTTKGNYMKFIILIILSVFLFGCSQPPVPEVAIAACIEKGGIPEYYCNGGQTRFTCTPKRGSNGN